MHPQAAMLPLPVGLLTALTAIQFRPESGTVLGETLSRSDSLRADSGFQLDLEIALSGFPAKVQSR
jgi:hypothetical protein